MLIYAAHDATTADSAIPDGIFNLYDHDVCRGTHTVELLLGSRTLCDIVRSMYCATTRTPAAGRRPQKARARQLIALI